MGSLTLNNGAVQVGYNGVPWTFSKSPDDAFFQTVAPVTRKPERFRAESIRAAQEIGEKFQGQPIFVFYSGGIDSEAVVESFRLAGVEFTVVVVVYEDGLNDHDVKNALKYLQAREMTNYLTLNFNILDWIKSEAALDFAYSLQTSEIGFTGLLDLMRCFLPKDACIVMGFDEPYIWRTDSSNTWKYIRNERHYSLHKFFMLEGRSSVPSFFHWSAELLASFMLEPASLVLTNGLYNPTIHDWEQIKYSFYWNSHKLLQRKKYTGYEKIITQVTEANRSLVDLGWNRKVETEVNEFLTSIGVDKR